MGQPKHKLQLHDGRTLLQHMRERLASVCDSVFVVTSHETVGSVAQEDLADLRPDAGPLGGIEAVLASGRATEYLFCPCDLPLVSVELLNLLVQPTDALARVYHVEGRQDWEPLPARIRADALPIVRRLLDKQQRSVWKLLREMNPDVITISPRQAMQLHNVNTRADYEHALRLLADGS